MVRIAFALISCSLACSPVTGPSRAREPAPEALAAKPTPIVQRKSGLRVAHRCYCISRQQGEAEFGLRLASDQTTDRGLTIRVFPGASRDSIVVNRPLVLGDRYEYVKFTIPALAGVEDFQIEVSAKAQEQRLVETVSDRCYERCDTRTLAHGRGTANQKRDENGGFASNGQHGRGSEGQ